jgi:hypothetical protein
MIACWIHICNLRLAMGLTHIGPNLITQAFVPPCHILCKHVYMYDCRAFEESASQTIVKVDNQINCLLHLHKRVIEKL